MSLNAGVRKICVFVLVFGVLAPRAFADFAVCQAGWEWVSDSLRSLYSEIIRLLESGRTDLRDISRLPTQNSKTLVRSPVHWRQHARDIVRSRSMFHLRF